MTEASAPELAAPLAAARRPVAPCPFPPAEPAILTIATEPEADLPRLAAATPPAEPVAEPVATLLADARERPAAILADDIGLRREAVGDLGDVPEIDGRIAHNLDRQIV